jgi:hypothetical protein
LASWAHRRRPGRAKMVTLLRILTMAPPKVESVYT